MAKNVLVREQHRHPNQDPILRVLATEAVCPARLALVPIMDSVFKRNREELHVSTNAFSVFPTTFGFKNPFVVLSMMITLVTEG